MKLAGAAALVADPSRAAMLQHLLGGELASAGELACAARVGAASASRHLRLLLDAGWLACEPRGRHRYYRLADAEVAQALQALALVADRRRGDARWVQEPALRYARRCYGHLAGRLGVCLAEQCRRRGWLTDQVDGYALTPEGLAFGTALGLPQEPWSRRVLRGSVAHPCLDWSERRDHLAGAWPRALLQQLLEAQWLRTLPGQRSMTLTPIGAAQWSRWIGPLPD